MTDSPSARSPLDLADLQSVATDAWQVRLVEEVDSTNALAAQDPQPGTVVVAEHQVAGRGRLDRAWQTPPGTALTFSAVVEPQLETRHWPLLPLATGLAVADGLRSLGARPALKWPNDVLLESGKVAGILLERVGDPARAVIGIGINVDLTDEELPVQTASALSREGVLVSRAQVLGAVLSSLSTRLGALEDDPAALVAAYRDACDTVGREVEAHLPGDVIERGRAVDVDEAGRLCIEVEGRTMVVAAGDVVHLRPV